MCARQVRSGEPVTLLGNRLVFTNWFFVDQGYFEWQDDAGRNVSVAGDQGPDEAHFRPLPRNPHGIRLIVHPAQRGEPLAQPDTPWDVGGGLGTILQRDGTYHAWVSSGWGDLNLMRQDLKRKSALWHLVSDDGYHWQQPEINTFRFAGSESDTTDFMGGSVGVFVDPSAPEQERFKLASEYSHWDDASISRYKARWKDDIESRAWRGDIQRYTAPLGAMSPDGIHWDVLPEPLILAHSDTQQVAYYDLRLHTYVLYTREWADLPLHNPEFDNGLRWIATSRRAVGRAQSADFRHFPLPEVVLQATPDMHPSEVLYTNCYTTIPGALDQHLMFPTVWDLGGSDATHLRLASSYDGILWNFVGHEPLFSTAPFGAWDGGCIFGHPNLIELPNGDWALPYSGYNVPHKYPRVQAQRHTGYALWQKGRLIGVTAAETGGFSTIAIVPPSDALYVNAVSARAGSVLIEVIGKDGQPLAGRTFADAIPLRGDCHWQPVRWREHDRLGIAPGDEVRLRMRLDHATLYGLEFRG